MKKLEYREARLLLKIKTKKNRLYIIWKDEKTDVFRCKFNNARTIISNRNKGNIKAAFYVHDTGYRETII